MEQSLTIPKFGGLVVDPHQKDIFRFVPSTYSETTVVGLGPSLRFTTGQDPVFRVPWKHGMSNVL